MAGTPSKVVRIASTAALVLLVAAACGSGAQSHSSASRGVPRVLAAKWAAQASAIADAAAAGNGCDALHRAFALRNEVIGAGAKVPARLRLPLVTGVNALADRLVCEVPPQTVTVAPQPPKKPPKDDHHDKHHGQGDQKGDHG
jgi:hypothetical protein